MIWAALGFVLGFLACAHAPEPLRLWAKRVTGNGQAKVTALADNIPIKRAPSLGEAASNIAKFFVGCVSFFVRHPVLCIGIGIGVVAAYLLIVGPRLPFGWGQSADDVHREIAEGEVETQVLVIDRNIDISEITQELAVLRAELRATSQRGHDAIAAATPKNEAPIDPNLVAAWRGALDELCVPRPDGHRADTCRSVA